MTSAVLTEPLRPFSIPEPSLSTRAMLCSLSISMWSARKHDPEASEEIASRHGARPDAGRYHKVLLPKEALNEIQQIVNEARQEHYFVTLPWSDDGFRVLPAAAYFDHRAKMRALADRFYPAVDSLVNRFTQHIEEARVRLGGLFREADYPHPEELRSRFAFETRVLPLPYLAPDAPMPMTSCAPRFAEIKASPHTHAGIARPARKKSVLVFV